MNKTAIKNFAVWARTKLRDDIKIRAGFLGINEDGIATPLPASTPEIKYFEVGSAQPIALSGETLRKRERIVDKLQKKANETDYKTAYDLMIETYASDWFNRFVALRFMEVNERFADNMRVLSSSNPDRHDPDIVSQPFSSDLEFTDTERSDVTEWKAKNETDKLFRFLLIKRCNQLSKVLPGLFEAKGDESELMMRQSFIDKDGMIYRLVNDIDEEDWKDQVQIIGWLYQYYNSELKDETFKLAKKGKKITKERVPSATQLFTPDWIVRYMVENSLGRLWIEGHTLGVWSEEVEKSVADEFGWKYYLPEIKQESEVEKRITDIRSEYSKLNPEDLTFIDPSMGSGHILVYAFDVLMQIYESVGYTRRDAARSIIENNIYGLDIDDRAYQLAYFAVMMKACEYDGRFLERGVSPHVFSIQESNNVNRSQLKFFGAGLSELEKNNAINQIIGLLDTYIDAKEYGSILNVENYDWNLLRNFVDAVDDIGQMSMESIGIDQTEKSLKKLIDIGNVMANKFWVACTNPPYMGFSNMNAKLSKYAKANYENTKADLFAMFMERCLSWTKPNGFETMITQHAWMFLSKYKSFRIVFKENDVINMCHLGTNAFEEINGEVVQSTTFVIRKCDVPDYVARYKRLVSKETEEEKEKGFFDLSLENRVNKARYDKLPDFIYVYWISNYSVDLFKKCDLLEKYIDIRQGAATSDNERFLRLWPEVEWGKIGFNLSRDIAINSEFKWFPYNKGGTAIRWYGNQDYIVNYYQDGKEMKAFHEVLNKEHPGGRLKNQEYYFREGFTWSTLSNVFATRYCDEGTIFDTKGSMGFVNSDVTNINYYIGFLNSIVGRYWASVLAPTLDFNPIALRHIPTIIADSDLIQKNVSTAISESKKLWDYNEFSWGFKTHVLLKKSKLLSECVSAANEEIENIKTKISACEQVLDSEFIRIFALEDEIQRFDDSKNKISITYDEKSLIKSLISYAIGCLFGRYSLDVKGLAFAGGEWDTSKYTSFQPDADNVIPITDARYMEDDIVDRFCDWLTVVYGEECIEENLDYIANVLGTKGTDSRDIIRNYFLNDFFKDHCQTYSVNGSGKRPIYWLFDSGKQNGFKALVYMHRYNADTIGRVRVSYLHPLQEKYENEVRTIDTMIQSMTDQRQISAEEKRREKLIKQIAEVKEYDERLDHLAQEHIDIDLDDGVKNNYEKIQTDRDGKKYQILAPIK